MERPLGRGYTLEEVLGRGATGEVWRGRATDGGAPYAFKLLHETVPGDPRTAARLLRAGAVLMDVDHPHVVRVRDLVTEGPVRAIVMDLVAGGDLRALLAERRTLPPGQACRIAGEAAAGLAAIHAAGIAHGALRPQNVLLDAGTDPPSVRLTDFGVEHLLGRSGGPPAMVESVLPYAAPELAGGHPSSAEADLYALGIMLYEMCAGTTPFADPSTLVTLRRHAEQEPARPPGVPDRLWPLVAALLAKDPGARPGPAGRVAKRLSALAGELSELPAAPPLGDLAAAAGPEDETPAGGSRGSRLRPPWHRLGRRTLLIAAGVVVLAIAVGTAGYVVFRPAADRAGPTGAVPAPPATGQAGTGSAPAGTGTPTASYRPGSMPDLQGRSEREARALLPPRVIVQTVRTRVPGTTAEGTVVGQNPPPGAALPGTAQLTVSTRRVTRYLADLQPTSSGYDNGTGSMTVAGLPQPHALSIKGGPCGNERGWAEYDLGQGYTRLTGLAGIDDGSAAAGIRAVLEISGDRRRLTRVTVRLGHPRQIDLNVTGVLRLTLTWTFLLTGGECTETNEGALLLGDMQLAARPGFEPSPRPTLNPTGR